MSNKDKIQENFAKNGIKICSNFLKIVYKNLKIGSMHLCVINGDAAQYRIYMLALYRISYVGIRSYLLNMHKIEFTSWV